MLKVTFVNTVVTMLLHPHECFFRKTECGGVFRCLIICSQSIDAERISVSGLLALTTSLGVAFLIYKPMKPTVLTIPHLVTKEFESVTRCLEVVFMFWINFRSL